MKHTRKFEIEALHISKLKLNVSLRHNALDEVQLKDIKARLRHIFEYTVSSFCHLHIDPKLSNTLHVDFNIYDDCDQFIYESPPHVKRGASITQNTDYHLGNAWLYQTTSKNIQDLEHEFAYLIQHYWFGKQGIKSNTGLEGFFEGLTMAMTHTSVCHHTIQYAKNTGALSTLQIKDILNFKKSEKESYEKSYLITAYLLRNEPHLLSSVIQACQQKNFSQAKKTLKSFAMLEAHQQNFTVWIKLLQELRAQQNYKPSRLYCPIDSVKPINFEGLKSAQSFLEQYYYPSFSVAVPDSATTLINASTVRTSSFGTTHVDNGFKACLLAIEYSNISFLEDLLVFSENLQGHDDQGMNLVHHAAQKNLEVMKFFCEHATELLLETDNAGNNVLYYAAKAQTVDPEILAILLKHGVKIDQPNHVGRTPLTELWEREDYKAITDALLAITTDEVRDQVLDAILSYDDANPLRLSMLRS